jgi:hypothetical protein
LESKDIRAAAAYAAWWSAEHDHVEKSLHGIHYDRFGDFIGFDLITLAGEERAFRGREQEVEELIRVAWRERILITVFGSEHDPEWPAEIVLLRPPRLR